MHLAQNVAEMPTVFKFKVDETLGDQILASIEACEGLLQLRNGGKSWMVRTRLSANMATASHWSFQLQSLRYTMRQYYGGVSVRVLPFHGAC